MADNVRDRYQRAMSVPQEDMSVKLARLLKTMPAAAPQGSSPLLGSQALKSMADMAAQNQRDKPVFVDPAVAQTKWNESLSRMPAYQQPFTGLRNEPYAGNGLPPFEQPGGSLPMQNYMPQAMTEPHGVAGTPPPTPQPQMTAQPAMQPAAMPASIEPVPQDVGGIQALVQALSKKKMDPWAVNEGNFMDQYGG